MMVTACPIVLLLFILGEFAAFTIYSHKNFLSSFSWWCLDTEIKENEEVKENEEIKGN